MRLRFLFRVALRILVSTLLSVAESRGHAATLSDPSGTWLTEDGRARIRIERCGVPADYVCGYVVWTKEMVDAKGQPFRDRLNPDPAKRTRALLGHQILLGLKQSADGRFMGEVYNAEDGRTYGVSIWRDTPKMLAVKGCLLGVFCATQGWAQVTDVVPGQLLGPTGDTTGPTADAEWTAPKPAPAKGRGSQANR